MNDTPHTSTPDPAPAKNTPAQLDWARLRRLCLTGFVEIVTNSPGPHAHGLLAFARAVTEASARGVPPEDAVRGAMSTSWQSVDE